MTDSRIHLSYGRDEQTPVNIFSDHDWVRAHHDDLLARYGERFVVVYREEVLGIGETYQDAVSDAAGNLPPGDAVITPVVELLRRRFPLSRIRAKESHMSRPENG